LNLGSYFSDAAAISSGDVVWLSEGTANKSAAVSVRSKKQFLFFKVKFPFVTR
jgi:hypothetical protein